MTHTEEEKKILANVYRPKVHGGLTGLIDSVRAFLEDPLWVLQVSRPAFWVILVWLYMFPHQQGYPWYEWKFWLGLGYMTFPLNLLVYAWNDLMDCEMDLVNPRKGSWVYGARGSYERYMRLFPFVWLVNVPYMCVLVWYGSWVLLPIVASFVVTIGLYNLPEPYGLRTVPVLDLVAQCAYFLVIVYSCVVNDVRVPPVPAFVFNVLFAMHAQLGGELMDLEVDRRTGRRTTATFIGGMLTKLLMLVIVAAEIWVLETYFAERLMASMLACVIVFVLADMLFVSGSKPWTETEIKVFGFFLTLFCPFTVLYVWQTGCLSHTRIDEIASTL